MRKNGNLEAVNAALRLGDVVIPPEGVRVRIEFPFFPVECQQELTIEGVVVGCLEYSDDCKQVGSYWIKGSLDFLVVIVKVANEVEVGRHWVVRSTRVVRGGNGDCFVMARPTELTILEIPPGAPLFEDWQREPAPGQRPWVLQ